MEDARIRENRSRLLAEIHVGQTLEEAQIIALDLGFQPYYEDPVRLSENHDGVQQLIVLGKNDPSFFDTLGYVTNSSWMPFTGVESPYLVLNTDGEGLIVSVK